MFPITIYIKFTTEDVLKYAGKPIHIINYMYTYSSFRALNFMLSACRTNSSEAARDTQKVERACSSTNATSCHLVLSVARSLQHCSSLCALYTPTFLSLRTETSSNLALSNNGDAAAAFTYTASTADMIQEHQATCNLVLFNFVWKRQQPW